MNISIRVPFLLSLFFKVDEEIESKRRKYDRDYIMNMTLF